MRKMACSELVTDFDLYPRNNVDSGNVSRIANALSAGMQVPPVVIDKRSKRIIDGVHRVRAMVRLYGDDAKIGVVEKQYKDEREMFLDAMRYNASHGSALDACDRARCTIVAERLKISIDEVAGALHMPADKLGELKRDRTGTSGGLSIPLKRTVRHFAGHDLNERQVQANKRLSGMNQQFYVNQLIELIESKMLDMTDEELLARLRVLHGHLDQLLVA